MIGDRIKSARTAAGYSQTEMADKIQVSKQTLYKYENNVITNVPSDKIEHIALICGVSPAYLMGWEENIPTAEELSEEIRKKSDFPLNLPKEALAIADAYNNADEGTKNCVAKLLDVKREDTTKAEDSSSISSQAG